MVEPGAFQKAVRERGPEGGHTRYFQGQLRELRGSKDQGGAFEKGVSGLKAQSGQNNEGQRATGQKKEKAQGHHGQQTRLSDSTQYIGPRLYGTQGKPGMGIRHDLYKDR